MKRLFTAIFTYFAYLSACYADSSYIDMNSDSGGTSIGDMARNAIAPINGLGKMFGYICIIGGIGLLFGAVLQYKAHRENPTQVRLSTPFFLLVVGLILLLLPYIGYLAGYHQAMVHI